MTLLAELKDKQILVLGAGLTGLSCVRFLHAQGLSFAVNDSRDKPFDSDSYNLEQFSAEFPNAHLFCGKWCKETIAQADIIITSPGIDLDKTGINQFAKKNSKIIGDVELFCQLNNARVNPISILAVTGSNGKSTVVSLLAYLAKILGVNAQLGGNIGQPVLDLLHLEDAGDMSHANQPDMLVLELSSFQLETLNSMQAIGASVLNLSDDHLDRHLTMENYQTIKQGIYQQAGIAVINRDDAATVSLIENQQVISFGSDKPELGHFGVASIANKQYLMFGEQKLIALNCLPLAGMHNALNYLAALALGYSASWSLSAMTESLAGFSGLPHRCQRIASKDGICWINDSKATNVGATVAAIDGLSQTKSTTNKLILIAGGDGKGADFSPLKELVNTEVTQLITLGKDGDQVAKLVTNAIRVDNLSQAVTQANIIANEGDIVLLSPACASLDMFKHFAQRGDKFKHHVLELFGGSDDLIK